MSGRFSRERYDRQLIIDGFGPEAQEALARARVLVAGAGGLGCSAALYLAAAGIGSLRIVDDGAVELGNLNRQVLYTEADIGKPKVKAAGSRLAALNREVSLEASETRMDPDSLPALISGCRLIMDCLDNLPTRLALNREALRQGVPIVHGAVHGFHGQLMVVVPGETACLRCLYQRAQFSGVIPVIGVTPGLIGLLQATEAIKLITGLGRPTKGKLLVYDGLETNLSELAIPRDPDCADCGRASTGAKPAR